MLKLLLPYARLKSVQFIQRRSVVSLCRTCRSNIQLSEQSFRFSGQNPRILNVRQMTTQNSFTPRGKLMVWGISGAVILTSMIFINKWCVLLFVIPLMIINGRDVYIILKILPRDLIFIKRYGHSLFTSRKIVMDNLTVPKLFRKVSKAHGNAVMMIMDGKEWKYKETSSYANRVSRLFQRHKLGKGDVVCLMLNNSPEMIGILIGLTQIGVTCSLINYNLVSSGLKHCIDISKCSFLIVDSEHIKAVEEIRSTLNKDIKMYQINNQPVSNHYLNFEEELYKESDEAPEVFVAPSHDDAMLYIYTSGTSGTPKAAKIPHSKFLVTNLCSVILAGITRADKIYDPLPLYHTTGLIVGAGPCITCGIPVVIRKKFSSHYYFKDCQQNKCSLGMYVGEVCRFIYMVRPVDSDSKHGVKLMLGNGLNPELWPKFQKRFNVNIIEIYGSTEGNCNMINIDGKTGAVGFLPKIVPFFLYPFYVIRIDMDNLEPIRDPNGTCIKCNYGETGMLVGRIKNTSESKFHGYVGKEDETRGKIISDVFRRGDKAFMTGDLLMVDEYNYFYFRDRTGDTFRWRGENVSSAEVENVISSITHRSCACFGVKGYDGYAGMICLEDPNRTIDLNKLLLDLTHHLPKYSIPRFVRIVEKIEMTSTHKILKKNFVKDGINLDIIKDKVYYLDITNNVYKPFTRDIANLIDKFQLPL